ncbi:MAG: CotH kinase family protein [Pirellulales bacterium]
MSEQGGPLFERVGMKLKGAAGSYREFNDRPALTIDVNKFKKKQRFHGLEKFSLNNSVQDETYLCEALAAELFQEAAYPVPRAAYVHVVLNNRDVGLYVIKEAFDKNFLKRNFASASGNLYEGGFVQDIDAALVKDEGEGPDDLSDLRAITTALQLPPDERRHELERLVDMPRFITFAVMEKMLGHWDGYTCSANNYRIYFDAASGRAIFLPHGMDQLFGDPGMPLFDHTHTLLGGELMRHDVWRAAFRREAERLVKLFAAERLSAKVDRLTAHVERHLREIEGADLEGYRERSAEFRSRVIERAKNIVAQLAEPDQEPADIDQQGRVVLGEWWPSAESEDTPLSKEGEENSDSLLLRIDGSRTTRTIAAWHHEVLLPRGSYRLHISAKIAGAAELRHEDGNVEPGGVDIVCGDQGHERFAEDRDIDIDFDVNEDRRMIAMELRLVTSAGTVEFRNIRLETRKP